MMDGLVIGKVIYGDALMFFGLQLPIESKERDFLSYLWKLQAMD